MAAVLYKHVRDSIKLEESMEPPCTTGAGQCTGLSLRHSGALDGLRESSSAVLDFRLLGEGLEGKDFFSQNEPLKAKLSDAPKIATSFHLLMSAHIGGGLWGEREVQRESPHCEVK